jgi:hypothetical protein
VNTIQKAPTPADPSEMTASVPVMFLVAVVALSTGYAFYLDVRREAANHRLTEWLRTERKTSWEALSRSDRFLTIRAVEILRRGPLLDDAEFQARYRLTRHGIRFAIAMITAGAAVAILILGNALFDWNW